MRSAFHGIDVIGKGVDHLLVALVELQRHFRRHVVLFAVEINDLVVDGRLVLVQKLHEGNDAALVLEGLFPNGALPLVDKRDLDALIKERQLSQALGKNVEAVDCRLEDLGVRMEGDGRAAPFGLAYRRQRVLDSASLEAYVVDLPVTTDLSVHPIGQRVDAAYAHAVQTAGHLVVLLVEFSAGVQHSQHNFRRGLLHLGMHVDRDASAIVFHRHGIVRMDRHRDLLAVASQSFVDGVIHNLVDQVMQTTLTRISDVHGRTLSYSLQTFQYRDVLSGIAFFAHRTSFLLVIYIIDILSKRPKKVKNAPSKKADRPLKPSKAPKGGLTH